LSIQKNKIFFKFFQLFFIYQFVVYDIILKHN